MILIAITLVAFLAAMLIPNDTLKLNTIVTLLFVLSTLLFFIIDNAFFILRAKRILKNELLKGHIKESPIGRNEIDGMLMYGNAKDLGEIPKKWIE